MLIFIHIEILIMRIIYFATLIDTMGNLYFFLKNVYVINFFKIIHKNRFYGEISKVNSKANIVRDTHGGGWSRNINARYLHTLMVYL